MTRKSFLRAQSKFWRATVCEHAAEKAIDHLRAEYRKPDGQALTADDLAAAHYVLRTIIMNITGNAQEFL